MMIGEGGQEKNRIFVGDEIEAGRRAPVNYQAGASP
jgi:hypothetical protein